MYVEPSVCFPAGRAGCLSKKILRAYGCVAGRRRMVRLVGHGFRDHWCGGFSSVPMFSVPKMDSFPAPCLITSDESGSTDITDQDSLCCGEFRPNSPWPFISPRAWPKTSGLAAARMNSRAWMQGRRRAPLART